jgi:hypothetical protein
MGGEARDALPRLREELQSGQTTAEDRVEILVVLATMGEASENELGEIGEVIASDDERALSAIGLMMELGRNEWANQAIRSSLVRLIGQDSHSGGVTAPWVLATLGKGTDAGVRRALEERFASDIKKTRSADYVFTGLALAVAGHERSQEVVGAVLKRQAAEYGVEAEWAISLFWPYTAEVRLVDIVASHLSDSDPKVAKTAAVLLGLVGLPAKSATPGLIRLVEFGKDQGLREKAARALGSVAGPDDLPQLRRLRTLCEGNTELQKWLNVAVREVEVLPIRWTDLHPN